MLNEPYPDSILLPHRATTLDKSTTAVEAWGAVRRLGPSDAGIDLDEMAGRLVPGQHSPVDPDPAVGLRPLITS
ncbi:MAG: hypothetical protein OXG35_27925 [Acidobacteria bacterium]|nr:hypothetical protein [Acidobacteriota bacterium]